MNVIYVFYTNQSALITTTNFYVLSLKCYEKEAAEDIYDDITKNYHPVLQIFQKAVIFKFHNHMSLNQKSKTKLLACNMTAILLNLKKKANLRLCKIMLEAKGSISRKNVNVETGEIVCFLMQRFRSIIWAEVRRLIIQCCFLQTEKSTFKKVETLEISFFLDDGEFFIYSSYTMFYFCFCYLVLLQQNNFLYSNILFRQPI